MQIKTEIQKETYITFKKKITTMNYIKMQEKDISLIIITIIII
jgi:hypothetical protein